MAQGDKLVANMTYLSQNLGHRISQLPLRGQKIVVILHCLVYFSSYHIKIFREIGGTPLYSGLGYSGWESKHEPNESFGGLNLKPKFK